MRQHQRKQDQALRKPLGVTTVNLSTKALQESNRETQVFLLMSERKVRRTMARGVVCVCWVKGWPETSPESDGRFPMPEQHPPNVLC